MDHTTAPTLPYVSWDGAAHPAGDRLGPLRVSTHRGTAPYELRSSRARPGLVGVGTQPEGRAVLTGPGTSLPCAPGDVFVADLARPWALRERDDFRLHLFVLPQRLIGTAEGDLGPLWGVHPASGGVARLLVPLLVTVAESAAAYPAHVGQGVAGTVADLLGTLAAGRGPGARALSRAGDHAGMARRVRQFVNENLGDPALGPELIAARHQVSVRYLHKVFEGEGTTLSRWIRRRRLEECRRELARPVRGDAGTSLAAVARRWGFANAAHFSRSFRAAYGISPSEWHRLRARSGTVS
ncbi:helix-turn-helix domain-containing protein [Streptomyces sp. NPDC015131]|uniref:helix-turn-helix domain-containing protein n=1 Tax=Streptomyces sp. NPDC015131 TaxID=3364941 RepID=UPI0036F8B80A